MGTLTPLTARIGRPLIILSLALGLSALSSQPAALGQPALAATRKLSAIAVTAGVLKEARVAGEHIIYLANYDVEERYDLYSAPLGGGAITRLTADLPPAEIGTFASTPAGRVVFSARHSADGLRFLYSVPAAGGPLTLLGPAYPAVRPPMTGSELIFGLAGERVIFGVDAQVANGFELFSVPAAGGAVVRLSPELPPISMTSYPAAFWVTAFAIDDGAGQHVAFNVVEGPAPQGSGLYAVPADGSAAPTRISGALSSSSDTFDLTPDGQRVIYIRGAELRAVSFAGGDDTLIDTGWSIPFAVTPDSARLVYALSGDYPAGTTIKSALLAGGAAAPVADDVGYRGSDTFSLTPDGAGVLYTSSSSDALLLAPLAGGITQTVFAELVGPTGVRFSADGARAIFGTWSSPPAIYSYPLAGGPALRIDDPAASAGGMLALVATVGGRAIYSASSADPDGVFHLYSVPAAGGASTQLTGDLGAGQELIMLRSTAGSDVVFTSGTRLSGPTIWPRLYAVPADGSTPPRLVDASRSLVGDVSDFAVSPLDGRAVYLADQERDYVQELYSVPIAGGTPTRLNPAGQAVSRFWVSPAGGRVVYLAAANSYAPDTLFSVPIEGGPPVAFSPDLGGARTDLTFTPDGACVIFGGDSSRDPYITYAGRPLYSAPVAGGPVVTIAERVTRFELDPTGARVAFAATLRDSVAIEIQSAPVTGGGSVTLGATSIEYALTGPLLFSGDGSRVIFQTGSFMGAGAIVSVPAAGGGLTTLVPVTSLLENATIQLSADGTAILYGGQLPRGDPSQPFAFRIQRLPVSGASYTRVTEQTLPPDSALPRLRFARAPGGGPVVFMLSRFVNNAAEQTLASVPESGGNPVRLSGPGPVTDASLPFVISGDGDQILFPGADGLYRVASSGGSPEQIGAGAVFGGFGFAEDGSALFVAGGTRVDIWPSTGQLVGGELFHAPLGGAPVRLADLPVGMSGLRFVQVGRSVVFPAVAGVVGGKPTSGVTELYAADIALAPAAGGFTAAEVRVAEGAGSAGVAVRLSYPELEAAAVSYRVTGGTAVAGRDYTLAAGPLIFAPGETMQNLPLTILDRPGYSGSRTIVIALGALAPAAASAGPTTVTVTIIDDEAGVFIPLLRR